jgi:hypothetical protein
MNEKGKLKKKKNNDGFTFFAAGLNSSSSK